jgi:DNA polymerase elongation subunit (family B)
MPATFPVVNAFSEGGGRIVLLQRRPDGSLATYRTRGEYAFFLKQEDVSPDVRRVLRQEDGAWYHEKEPGWIRVGCKSWLVRKEIVGRYQEKLGIQVYEGDVSPVRRLFADRGDLVVQRPRRVYVDLETDSRLPFSRKAEMRILVWVAADDEGVVDAGVLDEDTDWDERALLKQFFTCLMRYDQVVAWNGKNFDFEVIAARTERAGWNPASLRRWLWLDHMEVFKRMNMHSAETGDEKQSFSLNAIAQAKLGEGKDTFDASKTWEAWEAGGERLDELVRYCAQDTLLLPKIEKKTGYIDQHFSVCELVGVFPDTYGLFPSAHVDGMMFSLARGTGVHFGTKKDYEVREKKEGAYVMKPTCRGIQRDVHVMDFAGMYPSIITTFNIGLDTKRSIPVNGPIPEGHCRIPITGTGFVSEPLGMFSAAVLKVGSLRKESRKLQATFAPGTQGWLDAYARSTAYKVVVNSFPGVTGLVGGRWYDKAVYEAVTKAGEWLIKQVVLEAEKRGFACIYIDTDGAYFQGGSTEAFAEFAEWCNRELLPRLARGQGCARCDLAIEYQEAFERLVFTAAKKFCGRFSLYKGKPATEDSKPEVKGFEMKRGDATLVARRMQTEIVDLLCGGLKVARAAAPTEQIGDYIEAVERWKRHVLEDPLEVDEVKLSKGMSREINQYVRKTKKDGTKSALPAQARVAQLMEANGEEVHAGIKVAWVVVDEESKRIVPASQYDGTVDRVYLWNKSVWAASGRLLAAAFPDEDWDRFVIKRARKGRRALPGQESLFASASGSSPAA